MNFKKIFFYLCAFVLVLSTPGTEAKAYTTSAQTAVKITDSFSIFMIEYSFGHQKYDTYIPVLAERTAKQNTNSVSFNLYDDEDEIIETGNTTSIVVSNTKIKDGMYVIPKGHKKTLTLITILETTDVDSARLQVEYLPFSFNGTQQLQLNPSELQYYTTSFLTL